nr:PREDICTED: probable E3 ubiquitin-protein ligase bre1 [Bemisia tabaci]
MSSQNQNPEQSDLNVTLTPILGTDTPPETKSDETNADTLDQLGQSSSQTEYSNNHTTNDEKTTEIRKEITDIALDMAKLSDKSKSTLLKESERKELLENVSQLEKKKEELTKLLPEFDPQIASQFRTSTPEKMDIEETRNSRKRTSSSLNRSFSESDLGTTSRNLKPKISDNSQQKILSFFSKQTNSKEQLETETETSEEEDSSWQTARNRGRGRGRLRGTRTAKGTTPRSRTQTPKQTQHKPKKEPNNTNNQNPNVKQRTTSQTRKNTSNENNSEKPIINPETLFSSTTSDKTKNETANRTPENEDIEITQKICENYLKTHPTTDANALRRQFHNLYIFLEEHFMKKHQINKSDENQVNQMSKDIQEPKNYQNDSLKKHQETMEELKMIRKMLNKNNENVQQSFKQIDKNIQQGVKSKEEYPALQPYAEKLRKNLQCTQIAKKNDNIFNFELILKGERKVIKKEERNLEEFLMDKSKSFQNSKITWIGFSNDGKKIHIKSISTEKENFKNGLQKAINEATKEQLEISIKKPSEVMKIAALNADFSDEQIIGMIEENLDNSQYNREYIRDNIKIFRKLPRII